MTKRELIEALRQCPDDRDVNVIVQLDPRVGFTAPGEGLDSPQWNKVRIERVVVDDSIATLLVEPITV